jgi:hypothetical protein
LNNSNLKRKTKSICGDFSDERPENNLKGLIKIVKKPASKRSTSHWNDIKTCPTFTIER